MGLDQGSFAVHPRERDAHTDTMLAALREQLAKKGKGAASAPAKAAQVPPPSGTRQPPPAAPQGMPFPPHTPRTSATPPSQPQVPGVMLVPPPPGQGASHHVSPGGTAVSMSPYADGQLHSPLGPVQSWHAGLGPPSQQLVPRVLPGVGDRTHGQIRPSSGIAATVEGKVPPGPSPRWQVLQEKQQERNASPVRSAAPREQSPERARPSHHMPRIVGMGAAPYVPPPWKETSKREAEFGIFAQRTNVAPRRRHVPPANLAHPLSLADTPDLLRTGNEGLKAVPFFNPKWVDPQLVLNRITTVVDFFTGTSQLALPPTLPLPTRRGVMSTELGLVLDQNTETYEWHIREVLKGGAAESAGCCSAGDILKCINSTSLRGISEDEVADACEGPDGSQAVLLIQKLDVKDTWTIFLTRRAVPSGKHERISTFSPNKSALPGKTAMKKATADMHSRAKTAPMHQTALNNVAVTGFLEIEVVEAQNLPSHADACVQVHSQGHTQQTRTQGSTGNPCWREKIAISVYDPQVS